MCVCVGVGVTRKLVTYTKECDAYQIDALASVRQSQWKGAALVGTISKVI